METPVNTGYSFIGKTTPSPHSPTVRTPGALGSPLCSAPGCRLPQTKALTLLFSAASLGEQRAWQGAGAQYLPKG